MKLISCHSLSAAKRDIIIVEILQARELQRSKNVFHILQVYRSHKYISLCDIRYEIEM